MPMPRSFYRKATLFDRVTIVFLSQPQALSARAWVQDALIRAHGYATAHGLTRSVSSRLVAFVRQSLVQKPKLSSGDCGFLSKPGSSSCLCAVSA